MYKYYKKKDYKIMEYSFDSISEFIEYLDDHAIRREIFGSSPASETTDYSFCKTRSYDEAKKLCKYGYHENFDKLIELKLKLEKYIKMSRCAQRQYNYYVGYAPDVKAYLEGSPLSMLNKELPTHKHVDIYYNAAILGNVSVEQIFNRGAITLSIIDILENMGFSVGLYVFTMSAYEEQVHYTKFNLKQPTERINIQKLFFPLCNPSFLRRLVFRLREETPDIYSGWSNGYGATCGDYVVRDVIELNTNDIVICQPNEMNVCGYNIIDDANSMFDYINKFEGKDFILQKVRK